MGYGWQAKPFAAAHAGLPPSPQGFGGRDGWRANLRAGVDGPAFITKLPVMTATHVIRQLKSLPARERRKVFAYVDAELERREEEADRKAVTEARRDPRPPVAWHDAKKRLGLT
ncbi:MAG: hypothetical protein WC485_08700 [Opitutaceae bacterium]